MKQPSSQTIKIVSLAVLIIIIFLGVFYFVGKKGGNIKLGNPSDVVEDFIETWHENGTLQGKALADKISNSANLVSRDFTLSLVGEESALIDPATCLFKEKGKIKLARQMVDKESGQAVVVVNQDLSDGSINTVTINLIASGGAWRVNSIECSDEILNELE